MLCCSPSRHYVLIPYVFEPIAVTLIVLLVLEEGSIRAFPDGLYQDYPVHFLFRASTAGRFACPLISVVIAAERHMLPRKCGYHRRMSILIRRTASHFYTLDPS